MWICLHFPFLSAVHLENKKRKTFLPNGKWRQTNTQEIEAYSISPVCSFISMLWVQQVILNHSALHSWTVIASHFIWRLLHNLAALMTLGSNVIPTTSDCYPESLPFHVLLPTLAHIQSKDLCWFCLFFFTVERCVLKLCTLHNRCLLSTLCNLTQNQNSRTCPVPIHIVHTFISCLSGWKESVV